MAKAQPSIWKLEDHTRAKHELLTRYLKRWVPIFQHGYGRRDHLVFVDGFAGPGVYADDEPGSPVLMIREFLNADRQPTTTLHCFFVEKDKKRVAELERRVSGFRSARCVIHVLDGEYAARCHEINAYIDDLPDPAVFAFLDPFSALDDPDLAGDVVVRPSAEALVYLPVGHFARFLEQKSFAPTLMGVFGDDRWKQLIGQATREISAGLVRLYSERLAETGGGSRVYVEHFAIRPAKGERYYLFFATKHKKAIEAMREAFWQVDPAEGRSYDAKNPPQPGLSAWRPGLAEKIIERFKAAGRFRFEDAWSFVAEEVPPFDKKRLREALAQLRDDQRIVIRDPKTGEPSRRGFPEQRWIEITRVQGS